MINDKSISAKRDPLNKYAAVVQEFFQIRVDIWLETVGKETMGITHYWFRFCRTCQCGAGKEETPGQADTPGFPWTDVDTITEHVKNGFKVLNLKRTEGRFKQTSKPTAQIMGKQSLSNRYT